MFLDIRKLPYATYLYKTTSVRVAKGKYKKVRELIGTLEELQKQYDDPIAHFKAEIAKENKQKKENKTIHKIDFSLIEDRLDLEDVIRGTLVDQNLEKNLGSVFLQYLYYQMGLGNLLKSIKAGEKTKISVSKVLQLLILCRAIYPSSKLSDFRRKDQFADAFNISRDDIYRGLEILNKHKDKIISHLNNNISKFINYDLTNTHYDLTNYFVYTDNTTLLIHQGYSKVNNGLPTIQMALLTDAKGLPINYKLFSGNRNDVSTLVEFLEEQKKRFHFRTSTIVADAGIVSNDNMVKILLSGNHYIFKESLLRVNSEVYSTFEKNVKPRLEQVMKENPNLKGCYFSLPLTIKLRVQAMNGEMEQVSIPQKYLFMYSKKYDERSKNIRMDELENADKYIKDSKKLKNQLKHVASGLVRVDAKNIQAELDHKKLDKYEKTSGYSLLITDKVNGDDKTIIESYRKQYLIEESFRHIKTDLDLDNIYLRRDDRIEGHFLVGFLTLTFLRILQLRLHREYSIASIQEALREFKLHKIRDTNYYQTSEITVLIAKLQKTLDIKINKNLYGGQEIRTIVGDVKKLSQ